jgi:hypothetical protein
MRHMVENHGEAKQLALKARERVEQFYTIESVACRYRKLYKSLIASNRPTLTAQL